MADKDTWMAVVHGVRAAAAARRQRAVVVVFTETGKLPVKFDYWLGG